jgi:hypothetical protein
MGLRVRAVIVTLGCPWREFLAEMLSVRTESHRDPCGCTKNLALVFACAWEEGFSYPLFERAHE